MELRCLQKISVDFYQLWKPFLITNKNFFFISIPIICDMKDHPKDCPKVVFTANLRQSQGGLAVEILHGAMILYLCWKDKHHKYTT